MEILKDATHGKYASNWEGPFRVTENLRNEAYRLEEINVKQIERTWNASHLKHYFT